MTWNTIGVANGRTTLSAVAHDGFQQHGDCCGRRCDGIECDVALSAPTAGSTVSGASVTVSADAGGPVAGVQFQLDGANLGAEVTSRALQPDLEYNRCCQRPAYASAVVRDAAKQYGRRPRVSV